MTNEKFYDGETFEFEHDGVAYVAAVEHDGDHGAPWKEEDGHGNVSEWTRRDKLPGELVLSEEGRSKRFYDFAGACKTARRDGWGFLPGRVVVDRFAHSGKRKFRAWIVNGTAEQTAYGPDAHAATSALYKLHRESMTPRAYAAGAAMADYDRLRGWCTDQWRYIGVVVRRAGDCACCGETESLWGLESDAGEYVREVATELAEQLAERLSNAA